MTQSDVFGDVGAIFEFLQHVALKFDLFALLILVFCFYCYGPVVLPVDSEVDGAERPFPDFTYYMKSPLNYKIIKTLFWDWLSRHLIINIMRC